VNADNASSSDRHLVAWVKVVHLCVSYPVGLASVALLTRSPLSGVDAVFMLSIRLLYGSLLHSLEESALPEQVYKQADGEWQLEKSASLAVLRSHRAAIEALLADVKYDKIAHVRQVSSLMKSYIRCKARSPPAPGYCQWPVTGAYPHAPACHVQ